MFCDGPCGSVKWLYVAEPRVGWVSSLCLYPGSLTQLPQQFLSLLYALYGASIISLTQFTEPEPAGWQPDSVRNKGGNESTQGLMVLNIYLYSMLAFDCD